MELADHALEVAIGLISIGHIVVNSVRGLMKDKQQKNEKDKEIKNHKEHIKLLQEAIEADEQRHEERLAEETERWRKTETENARLNRELDHMKNMKWA